MYREGMLEKYFNSIGARIKVRKVNRNRQPVSIDIRRDRKGEYFDVALGEDAPDFRILQTKPEDRHLLLYTTGGERFLCGHDERHWFVAAIADRVSTVRDAKESLIPDDIKEKVASLPPDEYDNRRNVVFKRQGEWFFVPVTKEFDDSIIHKNEPLLKTPRSKPHVCQELIRKGGRLVYVVRSKQYSKEEYEKAAKESVSFNRFPFRTMIADPEIYVRGYVRHADHATITLDGWHRVFINGELTTSTVRFLD